MDLHLNNGRGGGVGGVSGGTGAPASSLNSVAMATENGRSAIVLLCICLLCLFTINGHEYLSA